MRNKGSKGYYMPPEWSAHSQTLVSWPVAASMVHPENKERVEAGYAEFIRAIAEFEPVTVLVNQRDAANAKLLCKAVPLPGNKIVFIEVEHNDSWIRDNGPTFVFGGDGSLAGVNWRFNAWGGKYSPWDLDDALAPSVLAHLDVKCINAPLVMEGGSFHTDGEGSLLTTEECLLNPNRNPSLNRTEIEKQLSDYLGISRVIWLKSGLDGDETDGHVDNIACFAAPGRVILQSCKDTKDPNFRVTQAALEVLRKTADAKGRALEIIEIPQPPRRMEASSRLTLSYLNFYFVNGGIILPVFGGDAVEADRTAVQVLSSVFPERKVRTIDGMAIVSEGGNVHCATQQVPKRLQQ